MNILIINGPNLNLLGKREPELYGDLAFEPYFEGLKKEFLGINLTYFQTNIEGEIIDAIHEFGFAVDGIVLNAGAYTHTSLAIADAIAAVTAPVIEVHISNVYAREEVRHKSFIAKNCRGVIGGFGLMSYRLAIINLIS